MNARSGLKAAIRGIAAFSFVWGMTGASSRKARRNMLEEYQGVALELISVDLGDEQDIERYLSFTRGWGLEVHELPG